MQAYFSNNKDRQNLTPFKKQEKMSALSADMICGPKLGLTMVRPGLHSAPEPPALDLPSVSTLPYLTFGAGTEAHQR